MDLIYNPIFKKIGFFFIKMHRKITRPNFAKKEDIFFVMRKWLKKGAYNSEIVDKEKIKNMGLNVNFPKTYYRHGDVDISWVDPNKKYVVKHSNGSNFVKVVSGKIITLKFLHKLRNKWNRKANNFGYFQDEFQYVKNTGDIFVEEFLGKNIIDYKIHYFNSSEYSFLLCRGEKPNRKFYEYDKHFNPVPDDTYGLMAQPITLENRKIFLECLKKTEELKNQLGNHYFRIDFFSVNKKLYLGEITLSNSAGRLFSKRRLPKENYEKAKNRFKWFLKNYKLINKM